MNYQRVKFFVALLFLLTACSAPPAQRDGGVDPLVSRFQQHVEVLADPGMEGRGPGTAGLDKARDYLVEQFKAIGVEPAFGDSYLQPFEIDLGAQAREQRLTFLGHALEPDIDFTTQGFSGDGAFDAEAVFVGYGLVNPEQQYDSFAPLGERGFAGKVAVVFRYEPMDAERRSLWAKNDPHSLGGWSSTADLTKKAEWAAQRGASALLIVNPPSYSLGVGLKSTRSSQGSAAPIPVMHIRTEVFERMLAAQTDKPRVMAEQMQRRADAGEIEAIALGRVAGKAVIERPSAIIANVAAKVPGVGDLADQVVIVGAHYDHLGYGEVGSMTGEHAIHPGADDNASGTAGLLLLADVMRRRAETNPDEPRRTVLFVAFSGEERGLLGSAHFTRHLADAGIDAERITAMLNFDMIGRMKDRWLYVFGVGSSDRWKALIRDANAEPRLRLRFDAAAMGASDQVSFYIQRVPVLHFFTGAHGDYHRPSDTAEKINAEGGAGVVRLVHALLRELASEPRRLAFREDESITHGYAGQGFHGSGAYLGVLPDYATLDAADGCAIQSPITGGPAEKAGLLSGDVITAWNGKPLRNVRDLTAVLTQSAPGEVVELTIHRGDETLKLTVTLGQR